MQSCSLKLKKVKLKVR